ncbi:MAG: hypothetical protein KDI21_20285 [Halieaceae bacterium]|nr:hypothetical protein [Halieaceae bacterium]
MASARQYLAQAVLYALFFLPIVYITHQPLHRHLPEDMAELKIAVRHAGKVIGECTDVVAGDYRALPGAAVRPQICPRERSPLQLELVLDGEILYRDTVPASGLHDDGVSSIYRRFTVPAGTHTLLLRMNDDVAVAGYPWELEEEVALQPAQVLVASFKDGFRLE